jgi:polyisoprenoid-binding protein YceI
MKHKAIPAFAGLWLAACLAGAAAAQPATRGEYRILPEESEVHVLVFRAGALGRLGHNHVVTARNVTGSVQVGDTPDASSFELAVTLAELVVDDPEARKQAGSAFGGKKVDEDDRAGTRRNMLGPRLLDAENHPEARVRSLTAEGDFDDLEVEAEIELRGARHTVELPVSVVFYGDRLVATGRTELTHAELGLEPFGAAAGTLRVAEELTFNYRIVAEAASAGERAAAVVEDDGATLPHDGTE